jgi:16S rRNA (guanine966-N2)-methyltransferase
MVIMIIGGSLKRRKLKKLDANLEVRPILARVKKSLFDIIRNKLGDYNFLDLYAGSGSVGIEALSRGAKSVVFIENNKSCARYLRENTEKLGLAQKVKISQSNVLDGLDWLRYKGLSPFEVIFLGPPYPALLVSSTLKVIRRAGILSPTGWIIAQHHKKEEISPEFRMFRQEKYGDTLLSFFSAEGLGEPQAPVETAEVNGEEGGKLKVES